MGTKNFDKWAANFKFDWSKDSDAGSDAERDAERDDPAQAASSASSSGSAGWLSKLGQALPDAVTKTSLGNLGNLGNLGDNLGKLGNMGNLGNVATLGMAGVTSATQKSMQGVASAAGKAKGLARSASTTISENAISKERWMMFLGGVLLGSGLMSLALMFLPMIVLMPQKFAILFSLGSLCFLASFSILRGHVAFARYLLSGGRLFFTITYLGSLVGTLWASLVQRSCVLAVIFSTVQVTALGWFFVSYIPGGRRAVAMLTGITWRLAKGCCRCVSKGSILPF